MAQTPLYSLIADRLAQEIAKGKYALGDILPTEPQLAVQLQVSRATVRAALSKLEARRLVSRKKNVGTRVESVTSQGGYVAELASLADLLQWAQACQRVVQSSSEVVFDHETAARLGCAPGSRWMQVQSLRFDSSALHEPVACTDAYIDEHYQDVLPAVLEQPSALISQLLEEKFGLDLAVIEQDAFGYVLSNHEARVLKAPQASAALRIIRRYLPASGSAALVTVSVHPADRFAIRSRLKKE